MSAVNVQPAISHKYLLNNTINALFPLEHVGSPRRPPPPLPLAHLYGTVVGNVLLYGWHWQLYSDVDDVIRSPIYHTFEL